jgi:Fe-S oxidoreductase
MSLARLSVSGPQTIQVPSRWEGLLQKARQLIDAESPKKLDADIAEAFYACTGCLRCQSFCEHGNDVPHALYQARAAAAEAKVAPAAARAVVDRFQRQGHDRDEDVLTVLGQVAGRHVDPIGATTVLFAGCEAPSNTPRAVTSVLEASRTLRTPIALERRAVCCGRPLYEAGYRDAFREHVRETWEKLGEREVVMLSAACARALTEWAEEVGVEPLGPVVHATTFLARRLGPEIQAPPLPLEVTYHDPCHLGRGLGEYEAPRRLLKAALEKAIVEPPSTRANADCCGASGLLPRTSPEIARAIAMTRADELRETKAPIVASACPACAGALRGAGLVVMDVAEIVAAWLNGAHSRTELEERE